MVLYCMYLQIQNHILNSNLVPSTASDIHALVILGLEYSYVLFMGQFHFLQIGIHLALWLDLLTHVFEGFFSHSHSLTGFPAAFCAYYTFMIITLLICSYWTVLNFLSLHHLKCVQYTDLQQQVHFPQPFPLKGNWQAGPIYHFSRCQEWCMTPSCGSLGHLLPNEISPPDSTQSSSIRRCVASSRLTGSLCTCFHGPTSLQNEVFIQSWGGGIWNVSGQICL